MTDTELEAARRLRAEADRATLQIAGEMEGLLVDYGQAVARAKAAEAAIQPYREALQRIADLADAGRSRLFATEEAHEGHGDEDEFCHEHLWGYDDGYGGLIPTDNVNAVLFDITVQARRAALHPKEAHDAD